MNGNHETATPTALRSETNCGRHQGTSQQLAGVIPVLPTTELAWEEMIWGRPHQRWVGLRDFHPRFDRDQTRC